MSSVGEQEEESGVVVHDALEVLVLTHCWTLGKCGFIPRYTLTACTMSLPARRCAVHNVAVL